MIVKLLEWGIYFMLAMVVAFVFCGGIHYHDCYELHVAECEIAHREGSTYLYCSGKHTSPVESDIGNVGAVHPSENCRWEIPPGCVLPENEYIDGLCLPFTDCCLIMRE